MNINALTSVWRALRTGERIKLGSADMTREAVGLTDAEAEYFNQLRYKTPAEPTRFECPSSSPPEAPNTLMKTLESESFHR